MQLRMPVVVVIHAKTFATPACTVGSDAQTIGWSIAYSVSFVLIARSVSVEKSVGSFEATKARGTSEGKEREKMDRAHFSESQSGLWSRSRFTASQTISVTTAILGETVEKLAAVLKGTARIYLTENNARHEYMSSPHKDKYK